MYACPTCGAGLVFDPKSQKLLCLSCRNQYNPEDEEKLRASQSNEITKQEGEGDNYSVVAYKCSHCGAELLTTDETITTFCSFCRTGTLVERKTINKRKPDYIIPFSITKEECKQIYVNKIKNAIFAPKSMIDTQEVEKIRGIYMPYWIYNYDKHGQDSTKGQRYSHRSGDYIYYDDYLLTTDIDAEVSGIVHDATSNFSDRLSEAIAPFSIKDKKKFIPTYLSGFYADNEDVDEYVYQDESKKIANEHISKLLREDKTYHKYSAKPNVSMDEKSVELALLPVYFLATKNKSKDRISYAVINGQTGKIVADIPIEIKKFVLISLILVIPFFLLLNTSITFSVTKLIICAILFNIIGILILHSQNKKIDNMNTDKGSRFKENPNNIETKEYENVKKMKDIDDKAKKVIKPVLTLFLIIVLLGTIKSFSTILDISTKEINKIIGIFIMIGTIIALAIRKIRHPEKDTSMYKQIIGLALTASIFFYSPASDIYYYIAALISIATSILSFKNIIEKFNILSTRKLPQLGKRGGDENA